MILLVIVLLLICASFGGFGYYGGFGPAAGIWPVLLAIIIVFLLFGGGIYSYHAHLLY